MVGFRDIAPYIQRSPPPELSETPFVQLMQMLDANKQRAQAQAQFEAGLEATNMRHAAGISAENSRFAAGMQERERAAALEALAGAGSALAAQDPTAFAAMAPLLAARGVETRELMAPEAPALPGTEPQQALPPAALDMPGMMIRPSTTPEPQPKMAPTGRVELGYGGARSVVDTRELAERQRAAVQPSLDALKQGARDVDQPGTDQAAQAVLSNPQLVAQGGAKALTAAQALSDPRLSRESAERRAQMTGVFGLQKSATTGDRFQAAQDERISREKINRAVVTNNLRGVIEMENEANLGLQGLNSGAGSLEQRTALANFTRTMFGRAQSNSEREFIVGAGGKWDQFDRYLRQWTENGTMTDPFVAQLKGVLERGRKAAEQRKLNTAKAAGNAIRSNTLVSDARREDLARAAEAEVLNTYYDPGESSPSPEPMGGTSSTTAVGGQVRGRVVSPEELMEQGFELTGEEY